ncbi:MAG: PfkB family carbohydrate kinase [Chloroflexota bacterium]|nr:PfkB family carbohydrate kinase [Chloroflexota bacterium]
MTERIRATGTGPEIVHVGSACRDVAPDDPRGWRLGGGVTYATLTTARLGLRTAAVIGVDDEASTASELERMREAGAELLLVPLEQGPIYHNIETATGRVQTCVATGVPLPVPSLPAAWLGAPAWQLAPVAGEIGEPWAAVLPTTAQVAVAWQGFLRRLVAGERVARRPPSATPILARADLVGVSHRDVDPDTPIEALTRLLKPGARLVVTRGHEGGLVVTVGGSGPRAVLHYAANPSAREIDPTGAGDTFLAALISTVVRPTLAGRRGRNGHPDLRFAAAAGSLVVEGPGLSAVPDLPAILARMDDAQVDEAVSPATLDRVGADEPDRG